MEIPKFHETFNPILEILKDGKTRNSRELITEVITRFYSKLPFELLQEKTKTGENLLTNRIAWGKSYLKKGGYITYPERGQVRITEKGLQQKTSLTLSDVEDGANLLDFYKHENKKTAKTKGNGLN